MEADREKVIWSLGTGARELGAFLSLLRDTGIEAAVDVRSFPGSRRFPHFAGEALSRALEEAGISYQWLGDRLGGFREGGYPMHMSTCAFRDGLEELEAIASDSRTAFFCAERDPSRCHRRFIARRLEERGWKVVRLEGSQEAAGGRSQPALPLGL